MIVPSIAYIGFYVFYMRQTFRTLAIGIKVFSAIDDFEPLWGPMMATALISVLPVLLLFLAAQRIVMAAFTGRVGDESW